MRGNGADVSHTAIGASAHGGGAHERSVAALSKEYETEVHFQKCYGVMTELFEAHGNMEGVLPPSGFKFLDLGCAPGGFSSFLLDDPRCAAGFGVTLPSLSGGFPVRVRNERFFLQQADLFEVGPTDLLASNVHVCICDAQYLRNNISWDDKYRGVRCRSKQHGVWALLAKQFWLGLTKLLAGGILIFRFGWRDPGPDDPATVWYKRQTLRLFTLLHDLFEEVRDVKSDYFNALQSSFYVCCMNFDRDRFESLQVAKLLGYSFNYLVTTEIQDSTELEIFAQVDKIRTPEMDENISTMLDRINKLRLINEQSRKRHQQHEENRDDPRALLFLSALPEGMPDQELHDALSKFGRVRKIDRDSTGAEASVQFTLPDHAQIAAYALRAGTSSFGQNVRAWLSADENVKHLQDSWSCEWASPHWQASSGSYWRGSGANSWASPNGTADCWGGKGGSDEFSLESSGCRGGARRGARRKGGKGSGVGRSNGYADAYTDASASW